MRLRSSEAGRRFFKRVLSSSLSLVILGIALAPSAQAQFVCASTTPGGADGATAGSGSVACGTLATATSGTTAVGNQAGALPGSATNSANTFIGATAGAAVTGSFNTATGANSGEFVAGTDNTATGREAGDFVTGNFNTAIGSGAGQFLNGSGNVALGDHAGGGTAATFMNASNTISIGTGATASKDDAIAIGQNATAAFTNSTAIGRGATTTRANHKFSAPQAIAIPCLVSIPPAPQRNRGQRCSLRPTRVGRSERRRPPVSG